MIRTQIWASALLLSLVSTALPTVQTATTPQVPPDKVYFTVAGTGFAFLRPKAWKMEKTKTEQRLYIPTAQGHAPAIMYFYPVAYRLPASDWQQTQVVAAPDLKRSVERQWQEEVLGIPLLLTKTTGLTKKGTADVSVTGLLYSATVNKMLFRLTCAAADFESADAAWRNAIQSLRTTDGSKVEADDPNRILTASEAAAKPNAPLPITILTNNQRPVKFVKGPVTVAGKAGGKNAIIRLLAGWTATPDKDGGWVLKEANAPAGVAMTLASTLDSEAPRAALFKQGNKTLDTFSEVKDYDEVDDKANRAGAFVTWIWRLGKSTKGDMTSCDASIGSGDFYILLHFQFNGLLKGSERKVLDELLSGTTIDQAP